MSARGDAASPIGGLACTSQRAPMMMVAVSVPMMMVAVSVPHRLQTGEGYGAAGGSRELAGAAVRCAGRAGGEVRAIRGQTVPAMRRAEAGWLGERSLEAGGRRPSSRLGSALGFGAVSGGAVLRRNRVRLVRHFWCYSGVVSGVARRNRLCSALGTARSALRSRSGVPGLWYRGRSRASRVWIAERRSAVCSALEVRREGEQ